MKFWKKKFCLSCNDVNNKVVVVIRNFHVFTFYAQRKQKTKQKKKLSTVYGFKNGGKKTNFNEFNSLQNYGENKNCQKKNGISIWKNETKQNWHRINVVK